MSIFYRFAIAATLMLGGLVLLGRLHCPRVWRFVVAQALCCFSLNFIALYNATMLIPSGLVSVIFSLTSVFNAVNARIFFAERITRQTVLAGVLGLSGLLLLFWDDLAISLDMRTVRGVGWAALGTLFFSLGNMASQKNSGEGVSPITANAWGMGIGAIVLVAIVAFAKLPMTIPDTLSYWLALAYLAIVGSVVGFTTFLTLVLRIGSARAGYVTVLFPVIALLASSLFEGYRWSWTGLSGLLLTGLGNIAMFNRAK